MVLVPRQSAAYNRVIHAALYHNRKRRLARIAAAAGGGGTPVVSIVSALSPVGDGPNNMDLIGAEAVSVHKSSLTVEAGTGGAFWFTAKMADVASSTHDFLVGVTDASYAGVLPGDNVNSGIGHRTANTTGNGTAPEHHNNDRLEDGSYVPIDDYTSVPFGATFGFRVHTIDKTFQAFLHNGTSWEEWSSGGTPLGARPIDNVVDGEQIEIRLKDYQSSGKAISINFGQDPFPLTPPVPVDFLGWGTP